MRVRPPSQQRGSNGIGRVLNPPLHNGKDVGDGLRPSRRFTRTALLSFALIALLFLLPVTAIAQEDPDAIPPETEPLTVVTKSFEPFVFIEEDGALTGYSIDLWRELARRLSVEFEFVVVETVTDQLDAVRAGEADLAIAGISITSEREETVDFSFPFYQAGLQVLTRPDSGLPLGTLLQTFFSPALLRIVLIFAVVIIIAAHIMWFLEHRQNDDFASSYVEGIWESIWWAAVTVTTVGYGDKTPRGVVGRIFGLLWMFIGLFLIANFTAGVTTVITLEELRGSINSVEDLSGKSVVTLGGSTADDFLREERITARRVDTIEEAYALLLDGTSQALVYDSPALQFFAINEGQGRVRVVGSPFNSESYGIAFPENSPLREPINQALLEMNEDGTLAGIEAQYFGVTTP